MVKKPTPIKVQLAIVSVRAGRKELANLVAAGGQLRVRLEGVLHHAWGRDDGIDQEFEMRVDRVEELPN